MDDSKYIAFIAYRHVDPDRRWAKWLQGDLEEYRLPRHLVGAGMTDRLGRVFRDEEELSASADLGESIKSALRRAQWLIVVCSPRTPAADWINDEIEEFRATRTEPAPRILTLLVEGDPATAFPLALRPDQPALRGRQPAAADVRPSEGRRTRELRRTAVLKIAAEIAGVPYDALKQRDEERARRRRRQWTIGLVAAALTFLVLAVIAGFQWYQARSRERAALARNAVWRNPAAATRFAADAWCASRTDESRDAVAAVLRESNVVAVWSDPALAPVTAAGFDEDATRVTLSTAAGRGWIWRRSECEAAEFPNYPMLGLRSTAMTRRLSSAPDTDRFVVSEKKIDDRSHQLDLLALPSRRVRSIAAASGAGAITTAAFSPDSRYLATGSFEAEVRIWNLEREPIVDERRFRFPREPVTSVRFNPGESEPGMYEVVAASHDGQARVWRFGRGNEKSAVPLRASTTALFDATFNPADPNMIATAGHEGKVFLWRRRNASAEWALLPQTIWVGGFEIREVSFSHDGELLVTASADNIARVWDWKRQIRDPNAKPVLELQGHRGALTAAEFSFDSKLIVTASTDGTVRVWLNGPTVSNLSDRPESHACVGRATEADPLMADRRSWADAFTTFGCFFRGRN